MPVPEHPRRIRVVGTSGSGKSHLAAQIADALRLPRLELDAVFWDAGWRRRDHAEALAIIHRFLDDHRDGWVIDGNWTNQLGGLLDPGTQGGPDVVVWLDHPRTVVMGRVIRRTLRRGILREELWHGNRERLSTWLRWSPEENIVRWAWVQHPVTRDRMRECIADGWPVIRLSRQREVDVWLRTLEG